jgi:hypothetical protein
MTNDQVPMTNESKPIGHWDLVIGHLQRRSFASTQFC